MEHVVLVSISKHGPRLDASQAEQQSLGSDRTPVCLQFRGLNELVMLVKHRFP